jgi:hypothetical protein
VRDALLEEVGEVAENSGFSELDFWVQKLFSKFTKSAKLVSGLLVIF